MAMQVKPPQYGTTDYWLSRAAQARALGHELADVAMRAQARAVATTYEVLAAHSEPDAASVWLTRALMEAEERVALGQGHIDQQRALITRLERVELNTDMAANLLRLFEEMQVLHCAHRDRLKRNAVEAAAPRWLSGAAASADGRPSSKRRRVPHRPS